MASALTDELAYRAIERLVYQSWWNADAEAGANAENFFCEDALVKMPARTMRGHQEVVQGYKARQARGPRLSRHLVNNLRIDFPAPAVAVAHYTALLYAKNGVAPMEVGSFQAICDVQDDLVLQKGMWLISKREVTTVFIAPDHDSVMLVSPGEAASK